LSKDENKLVKVKFKVINRIAEFMKDNKEYFSQLIDLDEQPRIVAEALEKDNYEPFLTWWNQRGSAKVAVTLDAISNFFGVDFEIYSTTEGLVPKVI
jgi:hypothetical protein